MEFICRHILVFRIHNIHKSSGCLKAEVDFLGYDIQRYENTPDVKTCIQYCYMTENCKSFTYIYGNLLCYVKRKTFDSGTWRTGTKRFSGNIAECSGTYYLFNDLSIDTYYYLSQLDIASM